MTIVEIIITAAIPLGLVAFWCLICLLIADCGWSRLAARFVTGTLPTGKRFHMQTAQIGDVAYRSCLKITVASNGIALSVWWPWRVGHPPLLIAWNDVIKAEKTKCSRRVFFTLHLNTPGGDAIGIPEKVFEAAKPFLAGKYSVPDSTA